MAFARRMFKGNAAATTLLVGISSGATTFTTASGGGTTYPTGGSGNFYVVIDRGLSTEEKILCSSRSGDAFTVAGSGRGVDDTTAAAHGSGAIIEHCITAIDADEANNAVSQTIGLVAAKGDLLIGTAANTLGRQAVGADATIRIADSAQTTGQKWVAVSGDATIATSGAVTLKNSGVAAGVKGDATHVPQITLDAQGRVTAETDVTISIAQANFAAGFRAVAVSSSAPGAPAAFDTWWDTTNKLLNVRDSTNTNWITITPKSATVATTETRAVASYGDLATVGPSVTINTGTSVLITEDCSVSGDNGFATYIAAPVVSGATTLAAADGNGVEQIGLASKLHISRTFLLTGLTAGSNTFKLQYKATAGTGSWQNRDITVMALPT